MKQKRLLFLFIGLLFLTLLTMYSLYLAAHTEKVRDLPEILEEKVLRMVTEYNSVDYYVSGDTTAGFQYELCKYIGKRSGLTVHIYLENNLDVSINGLKNRKYDVIARNIPITNESKQFFTFTVPVTQNKQVLVQRKAVENDSNSVFIANQIGLAHKTIYVAQNSPAILRLKNLSEEIAEEIHIEEVADYSSEQMIYMVAQKDIDYAVVDNEIAQKNKKLFPELDFETDISFTQLQAWALRKTSPVLLDSLNSWISDYSCLTPKKR